MALLSSTSCDPPTKKMFDFGCNKVDPHPDWWNTVLLASQNWWFWRRYITQTYEFKLSTMVVGPPEQDETAVFVLKGPDVTGIYCACTGSMCIATGSTRNLGCNSWWCLKHFQFRDLVQFFGKFQQRFGGTPRHVPIASDPCFSIDNAPKIQVTPAFSLCFLPFYMWTMENVSTISVHNLIVHHPHESEHGLNHLWFSCSPKSGLVSHVLPEKSHGHMEFDGHILKSS